MLVYNQLRNRSQLLAKLIFFDKLLVKIIAVMNVLHCLNRTIIHHTFFFLFRILFFLSF